MLRIVILTIFVCSFFSGLSQEEHLLTLEKAKQLQKKDIEGAITLLDSVWTTCKSDSGATEECLKVLTYLAYYYKKNRKYDAALEHYLMMIEYDKEGSHHSKAYKFLCDVLNKKKNHSLALDMAIKGYNHEKVDCRQKHNLSHSAAKSINYLGDSTIYGQGLAWIDTSLHYYQICGAGNPEVIAKRLSDKGNLYLKMKNFSEAIKAYKKCDEILDDSKKYAPEKYRILNNLGATNSRIGNHERSLYYYRKSIDVYRNNNWNYNLENLSLLYRNMARIYTFRKDKKNALDWIEKSDNYLDECLRSDSTLLAAIYSDKIRNRKEELLNHYFAYQANNRKEDLEKAYHTGKRAFTRYLILRSMVFGDQTRMIGLQEIKSTVDQLIKICLELGKMNEAFYLCEKTKYLNLLEHLDHFDNSSIGQVASRLQLTSASVHDLREIIEANKGGEIYIEKEINQFDQLLAQSDTATIYSYYLLDDKYVLFISKGGSTSIEYLEKAEVVDSSISTFLHAIKTRNPIDSLAHKLTALLMPAHGDVDSNITLIAHGHLAKLPFAALKRENQFLIEDVEFNYKKSLLLPNSSYNSKKHLGIQPQYQGSKLNGKLPFAIDEAQYLKNSFDFDVLQGKEATIENLKNLDTELNIMHLIGHCHVDNENYRNSYFSLSQDEKWTPLDILKTSLRSNLLVLSACSTSDGEFDLEEGIRGISYIFNITGNNNQITTNWSVDDEANFTIFKSFYNNLKEKNTVGQALRLSQLEYLDNASFVLSHPYFWAGMRYEGDPSLKIEIMPEKKMNYALYMFGALVLLTICFVVGRRIFY